MDIGEITALASGLALVLRAVAEIVKAVRSRRVIDDEPEPETISAR